MRERSSEEQWRKGKDSPKKIENEQWKEYQQGRIEKVKNMMEYKIYRQKQEIERKEKQVEERKRFFEMMHKQGGSSIDFSKSLNSQSQVLMPTKKEKMKEAKMRREYEQMMKSNSILVKLDHVDKSIQWKQEQEGKVRMFKNELGNLKKEEFKSNLKKREKVQEYYREVNVRKLREKEERAAQMKQYKSEVLAQKRGVQEQNNKQKKQVMELFDKMMKNSNSITPEMILEMFPGEQNLINKLMRLKDIGRSASPVGRSYQATEGSNFNASQTLNNSF